MESNDIFNKYEPTKVEDLPKDSLGRSYSAQNKLLYNTKGKDLEKFLQEQRKIIEKRYRIISIITFIVGLLLGGLLIR